MYITQARYPDEPECSILRHYTDLHNENVIYRYNGILGKEASRGAV